MDKKTGLVISYIPMFDCNNEINGKTPDPDDIELILKERLEESNGFDHADGCLWLADGGSIRVVLIMDCDVDTLISHMKTWSDYDIESRFIIMIHYNNERYSLDLMPELRASVERACVHLPALININEYHIIYVPIRFESTGPGTISKIVPVISKFKRIKVDMIHKSKVKQGMPPDQMIHAIEKYASSVGTLSVELVEKPASN